MFKSKISLILALIVTVGVVSAGCGKSDDDLEQDLTPRVIEEQSDDFANSDNIFNDEDLPVISTAPLETERHVITETDKDGVAMTDGLGNPIVSVSVAAVTTAATTARQLSEEEIQNALTQGTTAVTNVVATSSVKGGDKYAYNTLTAKEKQMYDDILKAAETLMWNMRDYKNTSASEWTKVFGMVLNQEPQLFWLSAQSRPGMLYLNENDPAKIAAMQKQIDAVVNPILTQANAKSSTYDKVKVFHDWLVLNCDFAIGDPYNATIYGAFVLKQAQCSGYAGAMKYLCDKAGINAMTITGTNGKGTTHAWNVIDVDGAWYNLDAMWNDPVFPTPRPNYIRHAYFLVPDKWIHNHSHHDVNKAVLSNSSITYFTPPACTETAKNYFTVNNLVFKDTASADKEIKAQIDKVVAAKGDVIELRVESKQVYDEIYKNLKTYQTYAQGKSSTVKGLADSCNAAMLYIQLNVIYN